MNSNSFRTSVQTATKSILSPDAIHPDFISFLSHFLFHLFIFFPCAKVTALKTIRILPSRRSNCFCWDRVSLKWFSRLKIIIIAASWQSLWTLWGESCISVLKLLFFWGVVFIWRPNRVLDPHQFHQFSLKEQTRHQLKWNTARECWYWIKTQTGVFDKGSVYMVSFETAPLTTEMNEKEGTCFRLRPLKIPAVTRLGFYTGNWWYFKLYWKLFFLHAFPSTNHSLSFTHLFSVTQMSGPATIGQLGINFFFLKKVNKSNLI